MLPKGRDDIPRSTSVRRPEEQPTHTPSHTLHNHTLKIKFFSSADQSSRHLIPAETAAVFSPQNTCWIHWRAPEGRASDETTHRWPHRCHATPFPKEGKTDVRTTLTIPQPRCQNCNWNHLHTLDTVLAILGVHLCIESTFHTVSKVFQKVQCKKVVYLSC